MLKLELSTTQGKLKLFILLTGILLVVMAAGAATFAATSTPKFCSSCHEMKPEFSTWQASPHQSASCISCHVKPGLKNAVEHKLASVSQVYYHFTNGFEKPIKLKETISNETCISCHQPKDKVGDIIIPHEKHLNMGASCITCHSGVAHGNISRRGVNDAEGLKKDWTADLAKTEVDPKNIRPTMDTCFTCHKQENANCAQCHISMGGGQ
ncbi:MAG: cytochrome c3 family protein [Bacillota bacterium]